MTEQLSATEQEIIEIAKSLQGDPKKLNLFLQNARGLIWAEELEVIALNAAENMLRQGDFDLAYDIAMGRGHTSNTMTGFYNKVKIVKNELLSNGDHKTACKLHLEQNGILKDVGGLMWDWSYEREDKSAALWFTELANVAIEQKDYPAAYQYNDIQWHLIDCNDKKHFQENILRFYTIAKEAWQSGMCEIAIDAINFMETYEHRDFTTKERRLAFIDAKRFYNEVHMVSQEDKLQKMKEAFTDEKNWFSASFVQNNTNLKPKAP